MVHFREDLEEGRKRVSRNWPIWDKRVPYNTPESKYHGEFCRFPIGFAYNKLVIQDRATF